MRRCSPPRLSTLNHQPPSRGVLTAPRSRMRITITRRRFVIVFLIVIVILLAPGRRAREFETVVGRPRRAEDSVALPCVVASPAATGRSRSHLLRRYNGPRTNTVSPPSEIVRPGPSTVAPACSSAGETGASWNARRLFTNNVFVARMPTLPSNTVRRFSPVATNSMQRFNDATIQRFNDSTIQRFNDSTIQRFNDSTIQRFNDVTIQRSPFARPAFPFPSPACAPIWFLL